MTVVGNATVVLHLGPFTVLTDPCFMHRGQRARLGYGLRSRRLAEPALQPDALPPLDAVVLSHHHDDHFDDRAAEGLAHDLPVVTTPHAARQLGRRGFTAPVPLRRWEQHALERDGERLLVTSLPARHGPRPVSALLPPVMGSMLEWAPTGGDGRVRRLYITGDTTPMPELRQIRDRFGRIDCCLIHLGGTRVLGVTLTMDGDQGREALRLTTPDHAVPVHHSEFTVMRSPLSAFTAAMAGGGAPPCQVVIPERGVQQPLPGWSAS